MSKSNIHCSANKLAEFITAQTPEKRLSVVRSAYNAAHSDRDFAPHYQSFTGPARRFLIGGASDSSEIQRQIGRLRTRKGTEWHEIDNRITIEAFAALMETAPQIDALGIRFLARESRKGARLVYGDVSVTVTPDLLVSGSRNGVPLAGSLRFYLAKTRAFQLGKRAAELVAIMQLRWLLNQWDGDTPRPDASLCMVLESVQRRVTPAPTDAEEQFPVIERACRQFSDIWHRLESRDAA